MSARTESKLDDQLVPLARKGGKVFIATLGFLLVAQNLGYSVSGLLAGLGIGGLALAMAAKDTLANLFGSLMIMLDRPFHVGDVDHVLRRRRRGRGDRHALDARAHRRPGR